MIKSAPVVADAQGNASRSIWPEAGDDAAEVDLKVRGELETRTVRARWSVVGSDVMTGDVIWYIMFVLD